MELDFRIDIKGECRYCSQSITKKNCIYETEAFLIIDAKTKAYPIHYVVISKDHVNQELFFKVNFIEIHDVLKLLIPDGFRIIVNIGENSGQIEDHLHFHIFGGCPLSNLGV